MYGVEVKVMDSEFYDTGNEIKKHLNKLNEVINQYILILEKIKDNSIRSGVVHDALETYLLYANKLEGIAIDLGDKFNSTCKAYIAQIDDADDYLYEIGGYVVRDFSTAEKEKLIKLLDDPICEITDSMGDKIIEWFCAKDVTDPKKDIDVVHHNLLDLNDATKRTINEIFERVCSLDKKYGRSIPGSVTGAPDFDTCYFSCFVLTFYSLRDVLKEMTAIISPENGRFDTNEISLSLSKLYEDLELRFNETMSIRIFDSELTIGEIGDFASQPWAASYFNGFMNPINQFLADIGGKETAQIIIFNMFDIAKDKIKDREEYEKNLKKYQLAEMLEEMVEHYEYENSDEQKIVNSCNLFLKYVKKYGDKWYDHLNEARDENGDLLLDEKMAKEFQSLFKSLGNAKNILQYGDKIIDFISKLLIDYDQCSQFIDSFLRNYGEQSEMKEAAEEIKNLYQKELDAWIKKACDDVTELGIDAAIASLSKNFAPIAVVEKIKKSVDFFGEFTGLGDKAKNMFKSMTYMDIYYSSVDSYRNVLTKIQNCDTNEEDYEYLINDLRNCFLLTKNSLKKMLNLMANSTFGMKKSYYNYCASIADGLTMIKDKKTGYQLPDIPTYEEYLANN